MIRAKHFTLAVPTAFALAAASSANAGIGMTVGDWELDFGGFVNGYYTHTDCDGLNGTDPTGVVAPGLALACQTADGDDRAGVRSGLLPSAFIFSAKTTQENLDIGVTFGFYPGINNTGDAGGLGVNTGEIQTALGTGDSDVRQNFLTFGQESWGTIKIGRDLGIFGGTAILSDITLLGVGSVPNAPTPANTTLGRIGLGYIYADFQPQISYLSPSFGGLQLNVGAFQPLDELTGTARGADTPRFEGTLAYTVPEDVLPLITGTKVWVGGLQQELEGVTFAGDADAQAYEVGAQFAVGPVALLGYYYDGKGVGTTGKIVAGITTTGEERESDGGYVQGTVTLGEVKLGVSYGESNLDQEAGDPGSLLETNESLVVGAYWNIVPALNLVLEYIDTEAQEHSGAKAESDTIAGGAILFF